MAGFWRPLLLAKAGTL